jgi:hypothetical protein
MTAKRYVGHAVPSTAQSCDRPQKVVGAAAVADGDHSGHGHGHDHGHVYDLPLLSRDSGPTPSGGLLSASQAVGTSAAQAGLA